MLKRDGMTFFGVGPLFTLVSVLFAAVIFVVSGRHSAIFRMDFMPAAARISLGVLLILFGIPLYLCAVKTMQKGFRDGKLCKTGAYRICRHPIYAGWAVLIVPGIMLLVNSWLGFTVPLFMCALLRLLVRKEEAWLERRFGDEYRTYRKRVPAVLPTGWIVKSRALQQTSAVTLDKKLCQACWKCVTACKSDVIGKIDVWFHKHAVISQPEKCTGCLACAKVCSHGAIQSK